MNEDSQLWGKNKKKGTQFFAGTSSSGYLLVPLYKINSTYYLFHVFSEMKLNIEVRKFYLWSKEAEGLIITYRFLMQN